jgi:hypothetical protein
MPPRTLHRARAVTIQELAFIYDFMVSLVFSNTSGSMIIMPRIEAAIPVVPLTSYDLKEREI